MKKWRIPIISLLSITGYYSFFTFFWFAETDKLFVVFGLGGIVRLVPAFGYFPAALMLLLMILGMFWFMCAPFFVLGYTYAFIMDLIFKDPFNKPRLYSLISCVITIATFFIGSFHGMYITV